MCEVQSEELSAVKSELASMKSELEQSASKCATRGEIIAMKTSALTVSFWSISVIRSSPCSKVIY